MLLMMQAALWLSSSVVIETPRDQYVAYFQGDYARTGQCAVPDKVWTFTPREISQGRLVCEVNKVDEDGGVLVIRTRNCTRSGEAVTAVTYRLDLVSADAVQASDGKSTAMHLR